MIRLPATSYQLLDVLRNHLIPWAEHGAPLILVETPPRPSCAVKVQPVEGELLRVQRGWGREVRQQFWLEQNLNAMSVPYLGCVLEGEADIMIGMTTAMHRRNPLACKRWVISVKAGQFFITPPGVPISAGGKVHWERPNPEAAESVILWFQFHPTGVSYHACSSKDGEHYGSGYLAIRNERFLSVVENVISEMQSRTSQSLALAYHHLSILFRYMARSLESNHCDVSDNMTAAAALRPDLLQRPPVLHRALEFIEMNLSDHKLNVATIATHAQVSPTHLNRIFREEMGLPVKQFVSNKRHEIACQMLVETSYSIRQISLYCGYVQVPSFIKAFSQREDIPPLRYRNREVLNNGRKRK